MLNRAGEYSARADLPNVFRSFAEAGIAVHTYDAHGHGNSEPFAEEDRFLIWDFNHLVSPPGPRAHKNFSMVP